MFKGNKKIINDLIVHCILDDIDKRRTEINIHEKSILTITNTYFAALFVVVGIVFKEGIFSMFLLIPAFIASGMALILHKQRIIYTIGAYISMREQEINSIINMYEDEINPFSDIYPLKWEKFIHKFNSSRRILIIDTVSMSITFFPFLILYLKSLAYLYHEYLNEYSIPSFLFSLISWIIIKKFLIIFIVYILIFCTIFITFLYINSRNYSEDTNKILESR